ncbi:MAG: SsrA-binding protein [Candidatus Kapaibacteriota bacterium]
MIPLSVYFSGPYIKLDLGLAKGRRKYDKREAIKKRDVQKEIGKRFKI